MKLKFKTEVNKPQPDPFMCEIDGGWAMYVTGVDGIGAYASDSPFGLWEYKGLILQMKGCEEYWAPCMIKIDDLIEQLPNIIELFKDEIDENKQNYIINYIIEFKEKIRRKNENSKH